MLTSSYCEKVFSPETDTYHTAAVVYVFVNTHCKLLNETVTHLHLILHVCHFFFIHFILYKQAEYEHSTDQNIHTQIHNGDWE